MVCCWLGLFRFLLTLQKNLKPSGLVPAWPCGQVVDAFLDHLSAMCLLLLFSHGSLEVQKTIVALIQGGTAKYLGTP